MKNLHKFSIDVEKVVIPARFTYPFNYTPHELSKVAMSEVCSLIESELCADSEVKQELQRGKMFGVLVVKYQEELGYLAAFSGNIAHSNQYAGFVPPIYDLLSPDGFFVKGENRLNGINREIEELNGSSHYLELSSQYSRLSEELLYLKRSNKEKLRSSKLERDSLRVQNPNNLELHAKLITESQFLKAECKRVERSKIAEIQMVQDELVQLNQKIDSLKLLRKEYSAELQRLIFKEFVVRNAKGESCDLLEIFANTAQGFPPAGAGECAAPKLLQYAYLNGMEPLCMAEFWWGNSPKEEVRRHGEFYPSCKSKCEPILNYMMRGLNVEPNPILMRAGGKRPRPIYEDEWILALDKPAGMLSMRGKIAVDSVDEWLKVEYGLNYFVAHRLDMDTSGVLLIAKDVNTYKRLQDMFAHKRVKKIYKALLSRELDEKQGVVELPLIADISNRPFQRVDYEYGKSAVTKYEVIDSKNGSSFVSLEPITGRTHQLRVHAAHVDGLNAPIVGDNLYGKSAERLMLHAESVEFIHPVTGERITISAPCPFTL